MSSDLSAEITAIATAVLAIATAVLVLFAIVTAWYARQTFGKQTQEVGLLLEQSKREAGERHIAQAARIFTGAYLPDETPSWAYPYAQNASDLPIYDVQLWGNLPRD